MIQDLKHKEMEVEQFQKEFSDETGLGSCFIVAGVLLKKIGGKVVEGYYKGICHWWVEKEGKIIDFNCLMVGKRNTFICEENKDYEKEWETEDLEEVKKGVVSEGLMDREDYDKWFVKFEEVLKL